MFKNKLIFLHKLVLPSVSPFQWMAPLSTPLPKLETWESSFTSPLSNQLTNLSIIPPINPSDLFTSVHFHCHYFLNWLLSFQTPSLDKTQTLEHGGWGLWGQIQLPVICRSLPLTPPTSSVSPSSPPFLHSSRTAPLSVSRNARFFLAFGPLMLPLILTGLSFAMFSSLLKSEPSPTARIFTHIETFPALYPDCLPVCSPSRLKTRGGVRILFTAVFLRLQNTAWGKVGAGYKTAQSITHPWRSLK